VWQVVSNSHKSHNQKKILNMGQCSHKWNRGSQEWNSIIQGLDMYHYNKLFCTENISL
jgi:hypothetical protein